MSYLGNDPNTGSFFQQKFTGDGSTTSFTLQNGVTDGTSILVTIGNVIQEESVAYTASGTTLTFTSAPLNNDVIAVRYLGRALNTPLSYVNRTVFKYTATSGQTAFTGADANGVTLSYTQGFTDVYLNGVHLDTTDFQETNESTLTLVSGATASDELVIVAHADFNIANALPISGGSIAGSLTVDTNTFKVDATNNRVGVKTASPAYDLDVAGNINLTGNLTQNGSAFSSGGGSYKGDNGTINSSGTGDIFRVHQQQLDTATTIASTENALACGPLTIASGITLTVSGNLSIV